jgi:hypothetical protein
MGLTKPRAAQIYNLDYKQSVRVVTVANITLTGGAPAVVDGVNLSQSDRILVTGQTTGTQNGLYQVATVGTGSDGTWTRTNDGNDTGEIESGMIVMVTEGTVYKDTQWKLTTENPITIGTTTLVFDQNYSANSISAGSSNVSVLANANVTISSAGTANVLTISSTGTVTTGTASVTGNITGGNVLTGGLISATGNITGGNITITGKANISTFIGNVFFGSVPAQPTYYTIAPLNLNNSLAAATKVQLNLINTGGGAGAGSAIDFYTYQISIAAANAESRIAAIDDGNYSAYLSLQTKTPGSTGTNGLVERVKVDSTGASVVANITGGNILTGGRVSATGNVTGNYFLGNGSQLTGVSTTSSNINNGTSNVTVVSSGGNITVGVGGTANVAVFATTGEYVTGIVSATGNVIANIINSTSGLMINSNTISANYTLPSNYNAMSAGPITVAALGNVSVGDGQRWTIV